MDQLSTINPVVLLAALFVIVFVFWSAHKANYPAYQARKYLMTATERHFYLILLRWTNHRYHCFSKVRIADVIDVSKSHSKKAWWKKFVNISSKHVDFVLCDKNDGSIQICIELDDITHQQTDRKKRDLFIEQVFAEAGLKLFRVPVSSTYNREIFKTLLDAQ